jgi:putative phosphoesterase
VALLADVHGNAVALETCLADLATLGVDRIHVLGDVVGYLPEPRRCLALLDAAGAIHQRGNHEQLLAAGGGAAPAYRHGEALVDLGPEAVARMAAWPVRREENWAGRRALLVHGSPTDPLDGRVYPDADLGPLASLDADIVVMGHTHRPLVSRSGDVLVLNPGSVGLPRDVGALSSYAVYDTASDEAAVRRVPIDVDAVLSRYGERIDTSVRAVFARTTDRYVGTVGA